MDVSVVKELQASYLNVKKSLAENLCSHDDILFAFQYAGFSPSESFVQTIWSKNSETGLSFEEYLEICSKLKIPSQEDIALKFSNVFGSSETKIKLHDFKKMLASNGESGLSEEILVDLIKDAGALHNNYVDCAKMSEVIYQTARQLKQTSVDRLEEKSNNQKLNSKTFTKRHHKVTASSINGSSAWYTSVLKGNFYMEGSALISHQYKLNIANDGVTVVKIEPSPTEERSPHNSSVDTLAYLFKENSEGGRLFIGVTDMKDSEGVNFWQGDLSAGNYLIIPFTSGCRLPLPVSNREEMPLFNRSGPQGQVLLTREFKSLLLQIFDLLDLDSSGGLSRQEFNLYNWRTSGEEVQDDEWAVVQSNFSVHNNELTPEGFLDLHQLEAEDSGGVEEDLWLSLQAMGYDKSGQVVGCVSYSVSALSQVCHPSLVVSGLRTGGLLLDKAIVRKAMESSEPVRIKNMMDLIKYQHVTKERACIVLQNKSQRSIRLCVDVSDSSNIISHRKHLNFTLELPSKSAIVAHHILPKDPNVPWHLTCTETLL